MKVKDVMTREVLTVGPDASLKSVADVLAAHGISGVPVCDVKGRVLGVVSETDILHKERGREGRIGPLYAVANAHARKAQAKAAARTAGEAMSSPAITIDLERRVDEAARLMLERQVNRLPVVAGDRLVGIVTRADLIRAFRRSDEEIARELTEDVLKGVFELEPGRVRCDVAGGEVTLEGEVDERSDAGLIERLVARVPGVVSVSSRLTWRLDDSEHRRGDPVAPKLG